jgi:hypothetical protein
MLFFVAAEGAFDPVKMPFKATLMTKQIPLSIFLFPYFTDFRFFASNGAVPLRPFRFFYYFSIFFSNDLQFRS